MGLWSRSFNLYRLQKKYRLQLLAFQYAGLLLAIYLITIGTIKYQEIIHLKPGTPLPLNAHTLLLATVFLIVFIALMTVCMSIGSLVHAVYLTISGKMNFKQAIGATFAAKYPPEWFKPGARRLS
jgi:hypothetical protein